METIWFIGIVVAFFCGWLLTSKIEMHYIVTAGMFATSAALMEMAAAIKNPVTNWAGVIAIIVVIIIGTIIVMCGAYLIREAIKGEVPLLIAIIIIAIGVVVTYPGMAYALFSLTATGSC